MSISQRIQKLEKQLGLTGSGVSEFPELSPEDVERIHPDRRETILEVQEKMRGHWQETGKLPGLDVYFRALDDPECHLFNVSWIDRVELPWLDYGESSAKVQPTSAMDEQEFGRRHGLMDAEGNRIPMMQGTIFDHMEG